jgi:hypothetical protein
MSNHELTENGRTREAVPSPYATIAANSWNAYDMRGLTAASSSQTLTMFGNLDLICQSQAGSTELFSELTLAGLNANGKPYALHTQEASQAPTAIPPLGETAITAPYLSHTKLNVQITPVPEVSTGVAPDQLLNHAATVMSAGAEAVRPIEDHLAQPNALNNDLINIPTLAIKHLSQSAEQVNNDIKNLGAGASHLIEQTVDILNKPMTADQRAKMSGNMLPLFFMEGPGGKKPLENDAVKQLNLEQKSEAELKALGIERGQLLDGVYAKDGIIAPTDGLEAVGKIRQTLGTSFKDIEKKNIAFAEINIAGKPASMVAINGSETTAGTAGLPETPMFKTNNRGMLVHDRDSEYKLLEEIAKGLSPDAKGSIAMFTEQIPCSASCKGVIDQFRAKFPNITFPDPTYAYESKSARLDANFGGK